MNKIFKLISLSAMAASIGLISTSTISTFNQSNNTNTTQVFENQQEKEILESKNYKTTESKYTISNHTFNIGNQIKHSIYHRQYHNGVEQITNFYTSSVPTATTQILGLDKIFLKTEDEISIAELKKTILDNTVIQMDVGETKWMHGQTEKIIRAKKASLKYLSGDVEIKNLKSNIVNHQKYKSITYTFDGLEFKPKSNLYLESTNTPTGNQNGYPTGYFYKLQYLDNIDFNFNGQITFYYHFEYSDLVAFDLYNEPISQNEVTSIIPRIKFKFKAGNRSIEDELLEMFKNQKIYIEVENDWETKELLIYDGSKFVDQELIFEKNKNFQKMWINKIYTESGVLGDLQEIFKNSNESENLTYENKRIAITFYARKNALNIDHLDFYSETINLTQNEYQSDAVDENHKLKNKEETLKQLNQKIGIQNHSLFNEVYSLNEVSNNSFTDTEKLLDKIDLDFVNGYFYPETSNYSDTVFFIAKVENYFFNEDNSSGTDYVGDFHVLVRNALENHPNLVLLKNRNYRETDAYFVIKAKTNKKNTIGSNKDNIWVFNNETTIDEIKNTLMQKQYWASNVETKNTFVETIVEENFFLKEEELITLKTKPLLFKSYVASNQNVSSLTTDFLKQIYQLPLNKQLDENKKIVIKSKNDSYKINEHLYNLKTSFDSFTGSVNFAIENKISKEFSIKMSVAKLRTLISDEELFLDVNLNAGALLREVDRYVNWYFIFLIIASIILVLIVVGWIWVTKRKLSQNSKVSALA